MTWIISNFDACEFHTDIRAVCKPIISRAREFNWLLNDIEIIYTNIPEVTGIIDCNTESAFLTGKEFIDFISNYSIQFVWGFLSAGMHTSREYSRDNITGIYEMYTKGLDRKKEMILPDSEIEIYCFDSTNTTIKFKQESDYRAFIDYYKL